VKYPHIHVPLAGYDDNAFSIIGRVKHALRRNYVERMVIQQYEQEALAGSYDEMIATTKRYDCYQEALGERRQ
jgi:hypothetical protein